VTEIGNAVLVFLIVCSLICREQFSPTAGVSSDSKSSLFTVSLICFLKDVPKLPVAVIDSQLSFLCTVLNWILDIPHSLLNLQLMF